MTITRDDDERGINAEEERQAREFFAAAPKTSRAIQLRKLYEAVRFIASTGAGEFSASGTLCGHIDFVGPFPGSYPLSPDEALAIIVMLQQARSDVLRNSDPLGDPRLMPHPAA